MDKENIMFFENDEKSYTMVHQCMNNEYLKFMILILIKYYY